MGSCFKNCKSHGLKFRLDLPLLVWDGRQYKNSASQIGCQYMGIHPHVQAEIPGLSPKCHITWGFIYIYIALPGILLFYLHIHLTTTHLNPNRCGLFVGFWLGIFAIHKTWISLAFWWRIDDNTGTLAYPVWCIVWVVQTQLFAENSNRGRKVSPEKLKSSKSSKNSKSRKVQIPGGFCSKSRKFEKFEKLKSRKVRKVRKIRKVEKFTFQEISA